MSGHRDPTAGAGIARAGRSATPRHLKECVVMGGWRRNGVRGFTCPGCQPQDREEQLLARLDRLAGGWS